MKTIKKVMLSAMIIFLASANAVALEDSAKVNDQKSYDLVISNVSTSTQITLKDKNDNILYENTLNKGESFSKTFNLELLPIGDYTVEIENDTKIKVVNLLLGDETISTCESQTNEIYKPVIFEKGSLVFLTQFSPENSPLYVAIYNKRNELLHEETLEGKIDLGRKYDFSKSYEGEYRFYLESNGMSYDHLVYVEK